MVRQNRDVKTVEFYVGTDVNGNKIPIPFENTLITGSIRTGKSMFVHNLLQDTLLRYPEKKVQFRVWSGLPEYDLWDVAKVTDGMRKIPNIRVVDTGSIIYDDLTKSAEEFLCEAAEVCAARYEHLRDYGIKNIWEYNRAADDRESGMVPLVYVLDEPMIDFSSEAEKALNKIIKLGRATGIILLWVSQGAGRIKSDKFLSIFLNKFVFQTDEETSKNVLGSSICADTSNKGVGQGMCIYQKYNEPYIPLDIPKFSYSLGKKIARALSVEIN